MPIARQLCENDGPNLADLAPRFLKKTLRAGRIGRSEIRFLEQATHQCPPTVVLGVGDGPGKPGPMSRDHEAGRIPGRRERRQERAA